MALGTIANDVRVPLVYIEIDNSQALSGNIAQDQKVLLLGQMTSSGTASPLRWLKYRSANQLSIACLVLAL